MHAKDKRRWFLVAMLCIVMCFFCGCTGNQKMTIDTTLQLNSTFQGKRKMSAVVPDSVFRQVFHGDIDEIQGFVTENCPSTLLCSADETDEGVEITMTMEFISLNDYTNKVGQILGKTPGIYYDSANSVFKNGFMIQENFSSLDLFGWLVEALKVSYKQFDNLELDDIFQMGTTMVQYDGRTFETTDQIHVEDMESLTFDSISAEITMNQDDSYKVALNFIVDQNTYYQMGDDMDKAIKDLVPAGGVYEVTDVNEQRVYTIGFSAYNDDTLVSQLNSVLKTKSCKFDVTETGDEDDPFRARKEITLYLDGSYFLDFSKEETELLYKVNVGAEYAFDSCESVTGFLRNYSYSNDAKYTSICMTVGPSDEVYVGLTYAVDIQKLEIDTKIINDSSYVRTFKFSFDSEQADLVGENFEKRLRARMDEDMVLNLSDSDSSSIYSVQMTGTTLNELSMKTSHFLDGSVNEDAESFTSVITGGKSDKKQIKTCTYVYEDTINLERFLGSATVSEDIVYHIEYPKGYAASFDETGYGNMDARKNSLTCTTRNPIIIVRSRGETTNIVGITQLLLWWASMLLTVLSLLLNIRHIAGYLRRREKYLLKVDLFKGKRLAILTIGIVAFTVFLFTTFRLIFRIY